VIARAAPTASARSRRNGAGSDTVMSSIPRARSTAVVSSPTGPPPVTSTRSAGVAPARLTVWIAIAVGSVSAAARVASESGRRSRRESGTTL
jgi:hypothetical protein